MRALVLVVALALALVAQPSRALAHGGRPQTYDVLFGATDADLVVPGTFGVMATLDGGTTWDWLCIEGMPDARRGIIRPAVRTPDQSILFAQSFGLVDARARACDPVYDTTLRDRFVADVTARPGGGYLAITSDADMTNRLYASATGADAFAPVSEAFPTGFLPERVRVAPSDPMRVYVSGQAMIAGTTSESASLWVSRDGGLHGSLVDVPLVGDESVLRILAVDPADPDRFFVVAQGSASDRLIEGMAAGATLTDTVQLDAVAIAVNRPFGLGFASDGSVWLGNTMAGLYRILPGGTPRPIDKHLHVACVVPHGDDVYLCGDGLLDPFALGVQHAGPDYAPVALMQFAQLTTQRTCGTSLDAVCAGWFHDLLIDTGRASLVPDAGTDIAADASADASLADDASVDDRDAGAFDGGAPTAAAPASCTCTAAGRGPERGALLVLLAIALVARRRASA